MNSTLSPCTAQSPWSGCSSKASHGWKLSYFSCISWALCICKTNEKFLALKLSKESRQTRDTEDRTEVEVSHAQLLMPPSSWDKPMPGSHHQSENHRTCLSRWKEHWLSILKRCLKNSCVKSSTNLLHKHPLAKHNLRESHLAFTKTIMLIRTSERTEGFPFLKVLVVHY